MSEKNIKEYRSADLKFIAVFIVAVILSFMYILPPLNADIINYDSAYQFFLTRHDPAEIARLLPEDYSPPLYTVILKLWTILFGDSLASMRAAALPVIWGMLFLAAFPVRKAFGEKTSLLCTALFLLTSFNFVYVPEIRPTVYAYFFVTAAAIYSYTALFTDKRYAYVCFTVFSLLAMYTHNIGMLSVLSFYIAAVLITFFRKKYRQTVRFIISGGICAVCYIPWLFVVLKQFGNVLNHYWADNRWSCGNVFRWTIIDNFGSSPVKHIIPVALLLVLIPLALRIKEFKNVEELKTAMIENKEAIFMAVFLFLLYLGPIIMLVLFSMLVYPIIAQRYFNIFCGVTMIIMAVLFGRFAKKGVFAFFSAIVIINFSVGFISLRKDLEESTFTEMIELIRNENPDGNIAFVHLHEWSLGIMMYYFPDAKHYIADDTWCVLNTYDVFPAEVINIGDFDNISDYEESFYYFGGFFPSIGYTLDSVYFDKNKYENEYIGEFYEPYTYQNNWRLHDVSVGS